MLPKRLSQILPLLALGVALISIVFLETARRDIAIEDVMLGETPATIYAGETSQEHLVIVSHGFGGSRQMMEAISLTLARAGHLVVAFDYVGHGRHPTPLSPDVATVTGTTEDLVRQTQDVVARARALTGLTSVSLVGHSMATDVIVRTAERVAPVGSVVAISMYSDAVTPRHPERLLVVSGASEGRLREVARQAVGQIGPPLEGETVTDGPVTRRAISAPWVGHVGVLWSPRTLTEVTQWLGGRADPAATGGWIAALLLSILLLFRSLALSVPTTEFGQPVGPARAMIASSLAALVAGGVAATGFPVLGLVGFGATGLAFGVWGLLILTFLRPSLDVSGRQAVVALLLLGWGIGAFALALDRYGAAFVPTGPRLGLMLVLLPAMVAFGLADRVLIQGRGLVMRVALRLPFLLALTVAMTLGGGQLGLLFTVLPVMVLFWVVYGTMAMWVARRTGPVGAGFASGVILAWSIAASTPLFQA